MFSTMFIILCCLFYAGMVGFSYQTLFRINSSMCEDCGGRFTCYKDHISAAFVSATLWPISWVVFGGMMLGKRSELNDIRERKYLDDAKRRVELARQLAKENQYLDAALSNLHVDTRTDSERLNDGVEALTAGVKGRAGVIKTMWKRL